MGFAPTKRWKSRSITRWDAFLNQNQPTDSAEEANLGTHEVFSNATKHLLCRREILAGEDISWFDVVC
jgi:hypothetical protein